MLCEQCSRDTDFLFAGVVVRKATKYVKVHGRAKAIGTVDVHRDGMVCFQCRPPSNLEIQEMLGLDKKRVRNNSLPRTAEIT